MIFFDLLTSYAKLIVCPNSACQRFGLQLTFLIFMALKAVLDIKRFLEDRFDVNDRRAVQCLQWTHPEPPLHVNL